jgi:hypothetical protein
MSIYHTGTRVGIHSPPYIRLSIGFRKLLFTVAFAIGFRGGYRLYNLIHLLIVEEGGCVLIVNELKGEYFFLNKDYLFFA